MLQGQRVTLGSLGTYTCGDSLRSGDQRRRLLGSAMSLFGGIARTERESRSSEPENIRAYVLAGKESADAGCRIFTPQIGELVIATSIIQLANGFFGTFISLRVAIENFNAAGLVPSAYFAGFGHDRRVRIAR